MQTLLPPLAVSSQANGNSSSDADTQDVATKEAPNGKKAKESAKAAAASAAAASEAKAANSKAATVEQAIDYIRTMQADKIAMELAINSKDEELNALRERLKGVDMTAGEDRAEHLVKSKTNGLSAADAKSATATQVPTVDRDSDDEMALG